jgi:FkbM family methyltransferase
VESVVNVVDRIHARRLRAYYREKPIDLVVDVGSHKGEFICRLWNDEIPIYSFEPQSSVRHILKENTRSKNVLEYFGFAVSDYEGEIVLFLNHLTSTTSTKRPDEKSKWMRFKKFVLGGNLIAGKEKVRVTTLDKIFKNKLADVGVILLKIDVEGSEVNVLRGALETISTCNIAYVQIEQASFQNHFSSGEPSALELLGQHGYRVDRRFVFPLLNFTDIVLSKTN